MNTVTYSPGTFEATMPMGMKKPSSCQTMSANPSQVNTARVRVSDLSDLCALMGLEKAMTRSQIRTAKDQKMIRNVGRIDAKTAAAMASSELSSCSPLGLPLCLEPEGE